MKFILHWLVGAFAAGVIFGQVLKIGILPMWATAADLEQYCKADTVYVPVDTIWVQRWNTEKIDSAYCAGIQRGFDIAMRDRFGLSDGAWRWETDSMKATP